jgi:ferredoxin--NADP+ reductase
MGALGTAQRPLRVAVVGSGPSGFYAAEALLQAEVVAEVDLLERLPVPYGLVRFGVAPDHARLKAVTQVFEQVAGHERFRFFGNVALGRDVSVEELQARYHAVVVATGAAADRKLGIPGEQLGGVHAASDFVGWYNGHPDCSALRFDLSQEVAVVVGQGNVALDVCRLLAKPVDALRGTDIAEHALDALAASRVREIHLVGRRGPAQARFTHKELRELCGLPGWRVVLEPEALALNDASRAELDHPDRANEARNLQILNGLCAGSAEAGLRTIRLHFQRAPVALHGVGRLERVVLEAQRLAGPPFGQRAEPTGRLLELEAGLLFRSVGYRSSAIPGLPFDPQAGTVPHREGRVVRGAEPLRGWYVTGWIKRGPTGIIGTNRLDSVETVARLLEDLPELDAPRPGRASLDALLRSRGRTVVGFDGWRAIECAERQRGGERGKPAEKFVHVADMLATAQAARAAAP